jgi:alpha-L-rhamnosidase
MSEVTSGLRAVALRTERRTEPLGIDEVRPRLSWHIDGAAGLVYAGYQVQTATDPSFSTTTWDTGYCADAAPSTIYDGPPLSSRQKVHWRARAFTADERPGAWSDVATFEMGLLAPGDWRATWIGIAEDTLGQPFTLTHSLTVPAGAVRARLYLSALGWARVFVDDRDLTDGRLIPRFSPFDEEVEYLTFALDDLTAGEHTLAFVVADGRFRGALGLHGTREIYGDRLGLLAQVEFEHADGSILRVVSDGTWAGGHGPTRFADPKDGETIDLMLAERGRRHLITSPGRVVTLPPHPRRLVAESTDPMREVDRLPARTVTARADGTYLVDFGQNIAGVVRLKAEGAPGQTVSLQHSEEVDADGRLMWEHLDPAGAKRTDRPRRFQRDEIVLDGAGGWVQPWFTYHGFRYVEISGLSAPLQPLDIEAVVLSSVRLDPAAFDTSNSRITRLHQNIAWSMIGNFLDTPTDCPTRERGGFTGDVQVFAPTATSLADVSGYLRRYLRSLRIDQLDDGRIPMVIPREYSPFSGPPVGQSVQASGSVGWGDASVLLPWVLYEATGDTRILAEQYDSMRAWVGYLSAGGARKGRIWGEWVRAGENYILGTIRDNTTNRKNIGLAYLAHSATILARIAALIGRADDAVEYTALAQDTVRQWRRVAVRRRGSRIGSDRQDDYVRALAFELLPVGQREAAAIRLADLVRRADDHLGTGFLSTAMLLPTLSRYGHRELAYRILLQDSAPGWLAHVDQGATTIWENWDALHKDGSRHGSSNHYAFGSISTWMTNDLVGLTPVGIARRRFSFTPRPVAGLSHAGTTVQTDFGPLTARWSLSGDILTAQLDVPHGVAVTVGSPDGPQTITAGSGRLRWRVTAEEHTANRTSAS